MAVTDNIYISTGADMVSVANKIRDKAGVSDGLIFPDGWIEAIDGIEAGGGGGGGSVPKPLTFDYMPDGYPTKSVGTVTLMEEQEVAFTDGHGIYQATAPVQFDISDGKTYTIVWDGVEYGCVGHVIEHAAYIGNPAGLGLESTSEPFLYAISGGQYIWVSYDTSTSHTIKVTTIGTVYQTIDVNMLPKAGENYGVVKKDEIVTAYSFPNNALHDQMVDAISAFKTGNASIVWAGGKVIEAKYNSSADTISVVFANELLRTMTFENLGGFYNKTLGSSTYAELQGNQVRIINDEGDYTVLSTEGPQSDNTLLVGANKIDIHGEVSGYALILYSSTAGSTKQFRVTVDDSGTLKATEI